MSCKFSSHVLCVMACLAGQYGYAMETSSHGSHSTSPFYAYGEGGATWAQSFDATDYQSKKPDQAFSGGLGVGYQWHPVISTELGWLHVGKFDFSHVLLDEDGDPDPSPTTQSIDADLLMFNVKAKPWHYEQLDLFVEAGVGAAFLDVGAYKRPATGSSITISGHKKTQTAWQVGAGLEYHLTSQTALSLGYRYIDMGRATTKDQAFDQDGDPIADPGVARTDLRTHHAMVRVTYCF